MKVKELIEQLQKFDPETRVVTHGYEGGFIDVSEASEMELALFVHSEWYYGPHEDVVTADHYKKQYQIEKSIVIA
jgi:hypothetical protein